MTQGAIETIRGRNIYTLKGLESSPKQLEYSFDFYALKNVHVTVLRCQTSLFINK